MPLWIETLNDPDEFVRVYAAEALAGYGTKASSAVPRLSEFFSTKVSVERGFMGSALKRIDPVTAARLGVQ